MLFDNIAAVKYTFYKFFSYREYLRLFPRLTRNILSIEEIEKLCPHDKEKKITYRRASRFTYKLTNNFSDFICNRRGSQKRHPCELGRNWSDKMGKFVSFISDCQELDCYLDRSSYKIATVEATTEERKYFEKASSTTDRIPQNIMDGWWIVKTWNRVDGRIEGVVSWKILQVYTDGGLLRKKLDSYITISYYHNIKNGPCKIYEYFINYRGYVIILNYRYQNNLIEGEATKYNYDIRRNEPITNHGIYQNGQLIMSKSSDRSNIRYFKDSHVVDYQHLKIRKSPRGEILEIWLFNEYNNISFLNDCGEGYSVESKEIRKDIHICEMNYIPVHLCNNEVHRYFVYQGRRNKYGIGNRLYLTQYYFSNYVYSTWSNSNNILIVNDAYYHPINKRHLGIRTLMYKSENNTLIRCLNTPVFTIPKIKRRRKSI